MGSRLFSWDEDKNEILKRERGIGVEDVVFRMGCGDLLDVARHPNAERYPNQKLFVVKMKEYVYIVPFVETDTSIFLKTIIPSRKATRDYLKGKP